MVKVFLKKLLESSVDVYRDELAAQRKGHKALSKLMVPKHVYQAINGNPDFEFLTNSGMGE